jgi:hypothetical protein
VRCKASGRLEPASTVGCDKQTLFLRQFQTQVLVDGEYRTIQECYDWAAGQPSRVEKRSQPLGGCTLIGHVQVSWLNVKAKFSGCLYRTDGRRHNEKADVPEDRRRLAAMIQENPCDGNV